MKEQTGRVIPIHNEYKPIEGCTVSKQIDEDIYMYSLSKGTNISAETYPYYKMIIVHDGQIQTGHQTIKKNEYIITPRDTLVGIDAIESSIYTEIEIHKEDINMNAGQVFELKNEVPYQEGKIINKDLINDDHMKFVVMSFDEGTGLSEHAAPSDALVFALDGQAIIGYEGKEHVIKEGEMFKFDANGKHYVKATHKFKMALLLKLS